jgi:hypothetical protein
MNTPPFIYYLACVFFKSWIDKLIFSARKYALVITQNCYLRAEKN